MIDTFRFHENSKEFTMNFRSPIRLFIFFALLSTRYYTTKVVKWHSGMCQAL